MDKLKYEAEKNARIKYGFLGMTTFKEGWWYNDDLKQWEFGPKFGTYIYSTHQPCRTVKAFKRKLKKAPKGIGFILASRWVGFDVYGAGKADTITTDQMTQSDNA